MYFKFPSAKFALFLSKIMIKKKYTKNTGKFNREDRITEQFSALYSA